MNKNRWIRACGTAVLALVMAAGVTLVLLGGMQISANAVNAYATALVMAVLCAAVAQGGAFALISTILGCAGIGTAFLTNTGLRDLFSAIRLNDAEAIAQMGAALTTLVSGLLTVCFFLLLYRKGGTIFALIMVGMIAAIAYALNTSLSIGIILPALIASVIAFAADGKHIQPADFLRALIPALLSVTIAVLLLPHEGITWKPLRDAANFVQQIFEEYFRFTEERVPFTINSEGYDYATEVDGLVEARLGGPANPDTDPVMRVTSSTDLLLRGSIRRTYTGHAWTDDAAKTRYLFLDFTRSQLKENLFGMADVKGFTTADVQIEFLAEGTSTLFVPSRLKSLSVDVENAVYYNSVGEIFLTRQVEDGDRYSLTALIPNEAAIRANMDESVDESSVEGCLQLPENIESGVYTLTEQIVENCETNYDRALAIEKWLKENCVYTLNPEYPSQSRDFVSQFVLDTREGYCSYFASAMTVMCRMAGVPARYVEGYYAKMDGAETMVLTGENAHAWTEVYLGNIGWVAFNPSGSDASSSGDSTGDNGTGDDETGEIGDLEPTEQPESGDPEATVPPTEEPTVPQDDGSSSDSPTPEPTETPTMPPNAVATPNPQSGETTPPPAENPEGVSSFNGAGWIFIVLLILILLLLLLLAVMLIRARLLKTDPIHLTESKTTQQAVFVLYRSCLTLLAVRGFTPENGESPVPFAQRVHAAVRNPDFVTFAQNVEKTVYARANVESDVIAAGQRAYKAFLKQLTVPEKLKFTLRRIFKGLGDFTSIP